MPYDPSPRGKLNAFRMNATEDAMLERLCRARDATRSEVVRELIRKAYNALVRQEAKKDRP